MKLLDRLREVGKRRHMAKNTIGCYARWVRDFLVFNRAGNKWLPPAELGARHVELFLTYLATERRVAASTQNQACNAMAVREGVDS